MGIAMARKMMTPVMMLINSLFTYAILGGVLSLITSAFLKRDQAINNPFAEEE